MQVNAEIHIGKIDARPLLATHSWRRRSMSRSSDNLSPLAPVRASRAVGAWQFNEFHDRFDNTTGVSDKRRVPVA
jgi:hypothetical protein